MKIILTKAHRPFQVKEIDNCESIEIATKEHGTIILWVDQTDRIVAMAKDLQISIQPRANNMIYLTEKTDD